MCTDGASAMVMIDVSILRPSHYGKVCSGWLMIFGDHLS